MPWVPALIFAICASFAAVSTFAQTAVATYPNKPVRLVHGFPAGGPADIFSRTIAQKLTEVMGQQVIVAAATPKDIVSKLHASLVSALQAPETKQRMESQGANAMSSSPQELAAYMRNETIKWGKIIKVAGIKLDAQ